jgi:hypothetical protein
MFLTKISRKLKVGRWMMEDGSWKLEEKTILFWRLSRAGGNPNLLKMDSSLRGKDALVALKLEFYSVLPPTCLPAGRLERTHFEVKSYFL